MANSYISTQSGTILSSDAVYKMFPVSFERTISNGGKRYDRVLSEENLIDWFRGVTSNSADPEKNSPYSYVLTSSINPSDVIEFLLGGYYLKLDIPTIGAAFASDTDIDIYAVIQESADSDETFRHIQNGDSSNASGMFYALKLKKVISGNILASSGAGEYRLHILTKDSAGNLIVPQESRRASYAVDGGVLE